MIFENENSLCIRVEKLEAIQTGEGSDNKKLRRKKSCRGPYLMRRKKEKQKAELNCSISARKHKRYTIKKKTKRPFRESESWWV